MGEQKYFRADRITEVTYKKQAQDYFERYTKELGRRISKQGHPVFTSFKAWCHAPTLNHPQFYIKIQLANKAGGSVFTELHPAEFDELISELIEWRHKYNHEIQLGIKSGIELQRRKAISDSMTSVLQDVNLPTSFIEESIEQKLIEKSQSQKEKSIEELAEDFIKLYMRYQSTNDKLLKEHLQNSLIGLIPNGGNRRKEFIAAVQQGTIPDQEYKDELSPNISEFLPEPMIDIDYSKLYNITKEVEDLKSGEPDSGEKYSPEIPVTQHKEIIQDETKSKRHRKKIREDS